MQIDRQPFALEGIIFALGLLDALRKVERADHVQRYQLNR